MTPDVHNSNGDARCPEVPHAQAALQTHVHDKKVTPLHAAESAQRRAADDRLSSRILPEGRLQHGAIPGVAELKDSLARLDRLRQTLQEELDQRLGLEPSEVAARTVPPRSNVQRVGSWSPDSRARSNATYGSRTALPGRSGFLEALKLALGPAAAPSGKLAVLFIELDGLKAIAGKHGCSVGDAVTSIVGARLLHALRSGDVVGYLGGDTFACMVPNLTASKSLGGLARKVFDTVAAPMTVGELELRVRPDIGVAVSPANGTAPKPLLRRAGTAMKRARHAGTGHAFFDPSDGS